MALLFCVLLDREIRPQHEYLLEATLVVAGEVVDIFPNLDGRRLAKLKVARVLKGRCEHAYLYLPFKFRDPFYGCDLPISYEKKKYLLCIDDRALHRTIEDARKVLSDYDAPAVRFAEAVLAHDLEAVMRLSSEPALGEAILLYATQYSRRALKPHLQALRRICAGRYSDPWLRAWLTLDPALLPEVIRKGNHVMAAIRRVTDRPFASVEDFEAWWAQALPRARAKGSMRPELLHDLVSGDVETRAAAREAILDLGPDVLDALTGDDPEVISLREELELIADLRR